MIQSKTRPTWEKKEPWKFVPRRDLFPDAELPRQYIESLKMDDHRKPQKQSIKLKQSRCACTSQKRKKSTWSNKSPLPEKHPNAVYKGRGTEESAFHLRFCSCCLAGWFLLGSARDWRIEVTITSKHC